MKLYGVEESVVVGRRGRKTRRDREDRGGLRLTGGEIDEGPDKKRKHRGERTGEFNKWAGLNHESCPCTMSLYVVFAGVSIVVVLLKNHASLQRRFVMATALVPIGKISRDQCTSGLFFFFVTLKRSTKEKNRERGRLIILTTVCGRADGVSGGVTIFALHFACRV